MKFSKFSQKYSIDLSFGSKMTIKSEPWVSPPSALPRTDPAAQVYLLFCASAAAVAPLHRRSMRGSSGFLGPSDFRHQLLLEAQPEQMWLEFIGQIVSRRWTFPAHACSPAAPLRPKFTLESLTKLWLIQFSNYTAILMRFPADSVPDPPLGSNRQQMVFSLLVWRILIL